MTDKIIPESSLDKSKDTQYTATSNEALPYSLRRKNSLNRIAHFGEWEWIPASNEVIWSDEMYEIFGIKPGTKITTESSINAFHPDDLPMLMNMTKKAFDTGIPQFVEARIVVTDGTIKYVQGTGEAILDADGKLERMIGYYQDVTEQKLTYLELEKTKTFYESLIRRAPDGVVLIDVSGSFAYASPSARRLFGYPAEGDIKDNPNDLTHPEDLPMVLNTLAQVINNPDYTPMIEYRFKNCTGQWLWVESIFTNMLSDPAINGIVINFREITNKKQLEQKQLESEQKFRLLIETMQEGVVFVNNDDEILYINKKCCDIYGYKQEDLLGKKGYEYLILPEDQNIILNKNKSRLNGQVDDYEIRGRKTTGEMIWLKISGAPIYDNTGSVIGYVGIMTDITTQKLALDALKQSEEQYRLLFESMLEGFAVHEMIYDEHNNPIDYRFLMVNHSFEQMTGLKAEQIIGKTVLEAMPNTEKYWIETYGKVALNGEPISYENYSQVLKKHFRVLAFCTKPNQFAVLIEDITESKNLKDQLFAAQKMDAIGQLAGGVAHDFNNLLTVILGYAGEIIRHQNAEPQICTDAAEIVKAGKRAASLTKQLLTFSRKQVIQAQILNINNIVENMHGMLVRLIGENINFKLKLADNLQSIKADPGQIEQVIMNLVVNARDAMPTGGLLTIETGLINCDETFIDSHLGLCPGYCTVLSVSDTGHGMSTEVKDRIFEPFFTTKEIGKGLGLGLSTVYGIVKNINGIISVYSEIDKGTTINIYIPITDEQLKSSESPSPTLNIMGHGQSIMVVEDEEPLCRLIYKMISDMGYHPIAFSKSKDALQHIKQGNTPDLIVTDVVMPELNGKQLIDQIRQINPKQKVLYMSGFTDDTIAHHGVLDDNAPFIQKPFISDELAERIYLILNPQKPVSKDKISILMLDDEEDIRILFERSCKKQDIRFWGAEDLDGALISLSNNNIDIILVDYNLGGMNGIDALTEIRAKGYNQPAIILTGMVNDDIVKAASGLNVSKVLEKSFDFKALIDSLVQILA